MILIVRIIIFKNYSFYWVEKMKNLMLIFIAAIFFSETAVSQVQEIKSRWGVYAALGLNLHSSDFNSLKDVPNCCPHYTSGFGTGFCFNGLYEIPVSKGLFLGGRLGYAGLSGTLSEIEKTKLVIDGKLSTGEFEHTIDGTFSSFGAEPYLLWNAFGNFFLSFGTKLSFLLTADYKQAETIVKPSDRGTFIDGQGNDTYERVRNESSGEIPDASAMLFHLTFAASLEFSLNSSGSLLLVPEIKYSQAINEAALETSWLLNSFEFGLSLKFVLPEKEPVKEEEPEPKEESEESDEYRM